MKTPKLYQRLLAMVLCCAMLLPMVAVPGSATEATDATVATAATAEPTVETTAEEANSGTSGEDSLMTMAEGGTTTMADDGTYTILAGSDFQAFSDETGDYRTADARAKTNMSAILAQVVQHHSIEAFLFGGDYSSVSYTEASYCQEGYAALRGALTENGLQMSQPTTFRATMTMWSR